MEQKTADTAIIIPAYKEPKGLKLTINEIRENLKLMKKWNIIILSIVKKDNHYDETYKIAKKYSDLVFLQKTSGKGSAIREAILFLRNLAKKGIKIDYVGIIDADFTYPASYFKKFIALLENKKNQEIGMVVGKRVYSYNESKIFIFGNRLIRLIHYIFNGVKLTDPLSGMRLLRFKVFNDYLPIAKSFEIEVELNYVVRKLNLNTIEFLIPYRQRIGEKKLNVFHAFQIIKWIIILPILWRVKIKKAK